MRLFEIETATEDGELAELLGQRPWVEKVEQSGTVARVTVRDEAVARRELPGIAAQLGEQLVRYQQIRPTLEDIFVRLVGA